MSGNSRRYSLPISVIVLTYNEERTIQDCLSSVVSWAGETFVLDSGSTDLTLNIAAKFPVKVYSNPFDNYSQQRNWAQDHLPIQFDWVLHIDADERITTELAASIDEFFKSSNISHINGAMFSRRTVFMGRWIRHGGHYPVFHARLFRRDKGRCEDRLYDQHFVVEKPVIRLTGDMIDVLSPDLDSWSTRHIRWAGKEAAELLRLSETETGRIQPRLAGNSIEQRRWLRKVLFNQAPLFFRAFAYFFYRYFLRRGFLDGIEGLVFHFLQACWFRFYVDAKIWEARRQFNDLR